MLYIIGGASRSGKSTISRIMLDKYKLPYLSLDFLVMGFTNGLPQMGIDANKPEKEVAEKLWPFLKAICVNIIEIGLDYVVEGVFILPEQVNELIEEYPRNVKACFIGYTNISPDQKLSEIRIFSGALNDWTINESDSSVLKHIHKMVSFSEYLKNECDRFNMPYFENSGNFKGTLERVLHNFKVRKT